MCCRYITGWLLRKSQVTMVNDFVAAAREQRSRVRQMIMGGGKSSVVSPLLVLFLADGASLTMQVVPNPLLLQSRRSLWRPFASILRKRVFTFSFGRSITPDDGAGAGAVLRQHLDKFRVTARHRGVVVTTPSAIKSLMLKFIEMRSADSPNVEHLHLLAEVSHDGSHLPHTSTRTPSPMIRRDRCCTCLAPRARGG